MVGLLYRLSAAFILAVLVAIFFFIQRQNPSIRVKLWSVAWILVFLHALIQVSRPLPPGTFYVASGLIESVDLIIIALAATVFLVSTSIVAINSRLRFVLFSTIGLPAAVYAGLLGYGARVPSIYLVLAVLGFSSGIAFFFYAYQRWSIYVVVADLALVAGGAWTLYRVAGGRPDIGFLSLRVFLYMFAGIGFWRRFQRFTPGVITAVGGFFLWAGLSATLYSPSALTLALVTSTGVWNVPQFLVAIGMIVTLLEDQTLAADASREHLGRLNLQMRRYADLTSQLLSGVEVRKFCGPVAAAISEASHLSEALILLTDDLGNFTLCGHSGITQKQLRTLQATISKVNVAALADLCRFEVRIGQNSYRARLTTSPPGDDQHQTNLPEKISEPTNGAAENVQDMDEVLVPLHTRGGVDVGCIVLRHTPDEREHSIGAEDLATIEILAGDLAIAIENSNLQKHLLRSERLAGVGQLVSGVAHELNNPLTAVMGYTEMLCDRTTDESALRELDIVRREALRMKTIIENLLRFSRQTRFERTHVSLFSMVDDILKLRAYDLRRRMIKVETELEPDLPFLFVDENLMKQVLMNVIKNAEEALESVTDKKISIEAHPHKDKLLIRILDNGPGFTDIGRAFDPFFTTKGVGKGTGLGLSICYGIVKELGGEITASNLQPSGGCVSIELPIVAEKAVETPSTTAPMISNS